MAQFELLVEDITLETPDKFAKVLTFIGHLDESNVDEQSKTIYDMIEKSSNLTLILDLGKLEYMNSKAIGYLTDWHEKISAKNGKIMIIKVPQNILDILKTVGITDFIKAYDTFEEAKNSI